MSIVEIYEQQLYEEIQAILMELVKEPPIYYNDGDTVYQCQICMQSTKAIYNPPGHLCDYDKDTFPHQGDCLVLRARRALAYQHAHLMTRVSEVCYTLTQQYGQVGTLKDITLVEMLSDYFTSDAPDRAWIVRFHIVYPVDRIDVFVVTERKRQMAISMTLDYDPIEIKQKNPT